MIKVILVAYLDIQRNYKPPYTFCDPDTNLTFVDNFINIFFLLSKLEFNKIDLKYILRSISYCIAWIAYRHKL